MKKLKAVVVFGLLNGCVGAASAQVTASKLYGEAGVSHIRFANDSDSNSPKLGRFIMGYDLQDNIAMEGLVAVTAQKDGDVGGQSYGVLMKRKKQVIDNTTVFLRLGVAHTERQYKEMSASGIRLAHGLGVMTSLTPSTYVQVDYMGYGTVNGYKAAGFTISVGTRF